MTLYGHGIILKCAQLPGSEKFEVRWQITERRILAVFLDGLLKERAKHYATVAPCAIARAEMDSRFKIEQPCPPEFCDTFFMGKTRFQISV